MINKNINDIAYAEHPHQKAIDHLMTKLCNKGVGSDKNTSAEKKKDIYNAIKNVIMGDALPFTILKHACDMTGLDSSVDKSFSDIIRNRRR